MKLSALERDGCPVCHVYWPEHVPEASWQGVWGGAMIHKGEPLAVLSSGERIPL